MMKTNAVKRAAGFSLVEVLISMVILSFALLGTAALTANGLKSTNDSSYRSQATFLADDILDRMRANVSKARGGQYNIDVAGNLTAGSGTLEYFDAKEWLDSLKDALPGGKGTVKVAGGVATIVITWDGGDTAFTTKSQL
jgi:type IV pilus assembly protein PilV